MAQAVGPHGESALARAEYSRPVDIREHLVVSRASLTILR